LVRPGQLTGLAWTWAKAAGDLRLSVDCWSLAAGRQLPQLQFVGRSQIGQF